MNQCTSFSNAIAHICGGEDFPDIHGQVIFYQKGNYVLVKLTVKNLPESDSGFYGFHIHEGGTCSGENFSGTGGHYNTKNTLHPSHAGDLPLIMRCNGSAYQMVATDRFCVKDIIGRTVVIHQMPDDFSSQPAGNAGRKIACGKIYKK